MRPTSLTLENFRCFHKAQRIELRPLTLLFGHNNAGKSAVLRALAMVADSLDHSGLDALNLRSRVAEWQWGFGTLRHYGLTDADEPTIGITLASERESVTWRISEIPDWRRIVVSRFDWTVDGVTSAWTHRLAREDVRQSALHYDDPSGAERVLEFRGLRPPTSLGCELEFTVQWLKAAREVPRRTTSWDQPSLRQLRPDGADASTLLAGDSEVLSSVEAWYARAANLTLRVVEDSPRFITTRVTPIAPHRGFSVDLIDSGEGLGQVLPVVTALQLLRHRRGTEGPDVVAVEEPELHLHKDLQRALLDEAIDVAAAGMGCVLFETHAPTLLFATQLALSKGRLSPDQVALYWVSHDREGGSSLREVPLDPAGWVGADWPPNALREDVTIQAELQELWDSSLHGGLE